MKNENTGFLLGLVAVALFALTLPATRYIIDYFNPVFIGLGRAVVAAVVAAGLLWITRSPLPAKQQLLPLAITSAGVVIGFPVFSAWAMQSVPASHGGIVLALLPLCTALVSIMVTHERPSRGFWLAAVAGSVLVIGFALIEGEGSLQAGDFALLAAIVSAAIGYAVGAKLSREMSGWSVICWALVIALPFILLPTILTLPEQVQQIPWTAWSGFLYLALFSQLIGFFLWYRGLHEAFVGVFQVAEEFGKGFVS